MKLLVVHDEQDKSGKDLAYLFYHEKSQRFYIELEKDAALLPAGLDAYVEQGQLTLNSKKAQAWVEQRMAAMTPPATDSGLENIDKFQCLKQSKGRSTADSFKLCRGCEHKLSQELMARHAYLIEDVVPLADFKLLVFFKNNTTRKLALAELVLDFKELAVLESKPELFRQVEVLAEGFALSWGHDLEITYTELMRKGISVPLTRNDFLSFVDCRILSTCQATELLGCTRQNINYLVDKQHLTPINKDKRTRLFLKQELLENL